MECGRFAITAIKFLQRIKEIREIVHSCDRFVSGYQVIT
jgi:hypothetical protein